MAAGVDSEREGGKQRRCGACVARSPIRVRAVSDPVDGDGRPLVRLPPWSNPTVYSIFSKGTYLSVGALEISKVLSKYHRDHSDGL